MATTLEQAALALARVLAPLASALEGQAADVSALLARLGWQLPTIPPAIQALATSSQALTASLGAVDLALEAEVAATGADSGEDDAAQDGSGGGSERTAAADTGGADSDLSSALLQLAADIVAVAAALDDLPAQLRTQLDAAVISATHIDTQFEDRLVQTLADEQLERGAPRPAAILKLLGIRETTQEDADPTRFQPAFELRTIHLDRLGTLLTDPAALMREVYGWGTATIDAARLFDALMTVSFALGIPAQIDSPAPGVLQALVPRYDTTTDADHPEELQITLLALDGVEVVLAVLPGPAAAGQPQPLVATLLVDGSVEQDIQVDPRTSLHFDAQADLSTGLSVILRPGQAPDAHFAFGQANADPLVSGTVALRLTRGSGDGSTPLRLLTITDEIWLEAGDIYLQAGADATGAALDFTIGGGLEKGRFVLAPGEADSFLRTLLPSDGVHVDFAVGVTWSRQGLNFTGSAGTQTDLAVNMTAGPLTLKGIHLALAANGQGISLEASLTGGALLGPLTAVVEHVGAKAELTFTHGNLGPVDLQPHFKPPDGLGLSIDSAVLTGGGFIAFDPDKGQYAGVLQLEFQGLVTLTAIGLLNTRLPGGEPGFSLIIIIAGSGFPPIQLGLGFTLTGVGGLVGINRTINADVLQSGLRSGSLNAVLFPQDPVKNAPTIISTLNSAFPAANGRYVFGPMAQIGWGTPTIVTIELAIILELPSPVQLLILGRLEALLPEQKAPIVQLRVDMLGVIDFSAGKLSVDASLRDSKVLDLVLTGDMALRMSWRGDSTFALSVGGFHPRFQPPPGFPALNRLALSLGGSGLTARFQAYMALTSNTAQIGAAVDLSFSGGGLGVRGHCGFDALFQFSPFQFVIDIDASVSVSYEGVDLLSVALHLTLSGPSPWHAVGSASIKISFLPAIHAGFDVQFGQSLPQPAPPAVDIAGQLATALNDPRSWSADLGADQQGTVTAVALPIDNAVRVHPLAALSVRQRVLPLQTPIDRFGNVPLPQTQQFSVRSLTVSGTTGAASVVQTTMLQEDFAAAQFQNLSDDDKLQRPSFESLPAGVTAGAGGYDHGTPETVTLSYETHVFNDAASSPPPITTTASTDTTAATLSTGAAARSRARISDPAGWHGAQVAVSVAPALYVVASTSDRRVRADLMPAAGPSIVAADALRRHLTSVPSDRSAVQILPSHLAVSG